ncbi:cysteine-rich receptor-like protein kinase 2 isoform X2 [Salvia hispanica]|uniref:cysteine-rich receptor-like protein kinase 2 isoform X2 n=1 Tax=Salvia hispanica TaxID=49212 RepID=UPI0020096625|nr:cysteine-rich receptor-like protein kinase 2 isoform X2 [Salvia hispanica]
MCVFGLWVIYKHKKMRWLLGLMLLAVWQVVNSDPQTLSLGNGCSSEVRKDASNFGSNLNATFLQLRATLSDGSKFATASSGAVYAMVQCRNYMSETDCLACYDVAESTITKCSGNGGRAVFDGCFLRYENYDFFQKTSESWRSCESVSSSAAGFSDERNGLLNDLQEATPRMKGTYFAASHRNKMVYAVAQCALTVTQLGCQACVQAAYKSLQNCNNAAGGRVVDVACFMRYSDQSFFPDNQTTNIKLPEPGFNEKVVIWSSVGGSLLLIVFVAIVFMLYRHLKHPLAAGAAVLNSTAEDPHPIFGATQLQLPKTYSYTDLKEATNNFSEENILGKGGFGTVYKATLGDGIVVAVKKLLMTHSKAKEDFESEVRIVSNVHHHNLVRLLGWSKNEMGPDLLLVYEFMENKSLDIWLYGKKRGKLSWEQRADIIYGTAKGIEYLLEHYHQTIIHRDIKSCNILVDNRFQAKIADFGLARLLPEDITHTHTGFKGTLGYAAPEYVNRKHLSEKVDIYSFGIVMLEIISGRQATEVNPDGEYLLIEARKLRKRGMHQELADSELKLEEYKVEDLKELVEIALLCVEESHELRPTMSEVIFKLSGNGSIGVRRTRTPYSSYETAVDSDLPSIQESDDAVTLSDSGNGSTGVQMAVRTPSSSYDTGLLDTDLPSASESHATSLLTHPGRTKSTLIRIQCLNWRERCRRK